MSVNALSSHIFFWFFLFLLFLEKLHKQFSKVPSMDLPTNNFVYLAAVSLLAMDMPAVNPSAVGQATVSHNQATVDLTAVIIGLVDFTR